MLARSMWTAGELITGASYSVINKRHHPLVGSGSDEQHSKGQRQPTTHTFTTPCAIINAVNVIAGLVGEGWCQMGKGNVHSVCTFYEASLISKTAMVFLHSTYRHKCKIPTKLGLPYNWKHEIWWNCQQPLKTKLPVYDEFTVYGGWGLPRVLTIPIPGTGSKKIFLERGKKEFSAMLVLLLKIS